MHKPDSPGVVAQRFVDEDEQNGVDGSEVDAAMMNALAYELCNAIEGAGIALSKGTENQLFDAIRTLQGYDLGLRNTLINGDMGLWQRGNSIALTTAGGGRYTADRWFGNCGGASAAATVSRGTFDIALNQVADARGFMLRWEQTAAATTVNPFLEQRVQGIGRFAGGKYTTSIWAKVVTGTINVVPYITLNHGSGGSAPVTVIGATMAVTSTWQRFTVTFDVPALTGKTIGSSSYLAVGYQLPLSQTFELDLTNAQAEPGSVGTRFEARHPALDRLLAMVYFETSYELDDFGTATSRNASIFDDDAADLVLVGAMQRFTVPKRTKPSITWYSPSTGAAGKVAWPLGTDRNVVDVLYEGQNATGAPQVSAGPSGPTTGYAHWAADAEIY